MHRLLASPGFVRWGIRIDTAPAWAWPLLVVAALAPTWTWMAARLLDRSDDPLGLLALAALALLAWHARTELRAAPRLPWLALALAGTVLATALRGQVPPLLVALVAVLSLAAALAAFLPARIATAPVALLAILALPLLASLQFYAGYPLRVLTAEASRWLLSWSHSVARSGASLWIDGRLVIVDAPCSGVQMAWLGYFTAAAVALHVGRANRAFLARLPAVGVIVLAGNIARNTVLVAAEGAGRALPPAEHDAVGLVALALVCAAVAAVMAAGKELRHVG